MCVCVRVVGGGGHAMRRRRNTITQEHGCLFGAFFLVVGELQLVKVLGEVSILDAHNCIHPRGFMLEPNNSWQHTSCLLAW